MCVVARGAWSQGYPHPPPPPPPTPPPGAAVYRRRAAARRRCEAAAAAEAAEAAAEAATAVPRESGALFVGAHLPCNTSKHTQQLSLPSSGSPGCECSIRSAEEAAWKVIAPPKDHLPHPRCWHLRSHTALRPSSPTNHHPHLPCTPPASRPARRAPPGRPRTPSRPRHPPPIAVPQPPAPRAATMAFQVRQLGQAQRGVQAAPRLTRL